MTDRAAFLEGFTERLRNVLQQQARETESSRIAHEADTSVVDGLMWRRLAAREKITDAAIDELARYLCDAFDGVSSSGVSPRPTSAGLAKAPEPVRVSPLPLSGDPRMTPTCKTCRGWQISAECDMTSELAVRGTDYWPVAPQPFELRQCLSPKVRFFERPEIDGAAVLDGSEYMGVLVTAEAFGCIQHASAGGGSEAVDP